jgi:putative SOS response-associated peptidase YedK
VCGRYTQTLTADELAAAMSALDATGGTVRESYNVAPTAQMPIVAAGRPGEPAAADAAGGRAPDAGAPAERTLTTARWGLVPSWAKDVGIGSRLINARAETLADKPAFRAAFARRRCLVPATGYYEWHKPKGAKGRGQPYFVHPAAGGVLVLAGLYEVWFGGETPLVTYTIVTTGSAGGLEFLHDRSPVVVPASAWDGWLAPGPLDASGLLAPAPAGTLEAYPVDPAVGNVRNQGSRLLDRVEIAASPGSAGPGAAAGRGTSAPTLFE